MGRTSDYLIYLLYALVLGGGVGVVGGVLYGAYVLIRKSVASGLLILGGAAAGALLVYVVSLALLAVATFVTDSGGS